MSEQQDDAQIAARRDAQLLRLLKTPPQSHAKLSEQAHVVHDATEAAYARGDTLDERRKLMQAWDDYCNYNVKGSL